MSGTDVAMPLATPIPFERQFAKAKERTCGAAVLAMAYRSLGMRCSQPEIWPRIARTDLQGNQNARTYLLAADALARGFAAVVAQTFRPWPCLQRLHASGMRAILNHRLSLAAPWGHFSLLVAIDDEGLSLHDPQQGPDRHYAKDEFLDLWRPSASRTETAGNVFVAIDRRRLGECSCQTCNMPVPSATTCPACEGIIPLQPSAALGCVDLQCPQRVWQRVFCPRCDFGIG